MVSEISEKLAAAKAYFKAFAGQKVIVAFSGGVDSLLVLALLKEVSEDLRQIFPVFVTAQWMSHSAIKDAEEAANRLGFTLHRIQLNRVDEVGIERNPIDRCYLCKKHLFNKLLEFAHSIDCHAIMEGTQLDDLIHFRPGQKAIAESGAISPLKELGLHKIEVRQLLSELGISAANKPSGSCLATRFPYGTILTQEKFNAVEKAEDSLKNLGFYNLRVRSDETTARIEVDPQYFPIVVTHAQEIVNELKRLGWQYVCLDLQGFRSGSMDEIKPQIR